MVQMIDGYSWRISDVTRLPLNRRVIEKFHRRSSRYYWLLRLAACREPSFRYHDGLPSTCCLVDREMFAVLLCGERRSALHAKLIICREIISNRKGCYWRVEKADEPWNRRNCSKLMVAWVVSTSRDNIYMSVLATTFFIFIDDFLEPWLFSKLSISQIDQASS